MQLQVENCYRIKRDALSDTKIPAVRQKESWPRQAQSIGYLGDTVEEAAISAAYKVAEAENKSFVAAEAVKEAERVSMMAEEMESLLQFATECFEQSNIYTLQTLFPYSLTPFVPFFISSKNSIFNLAFCSLIFFKRRNPSAILFILQPQMVKSFCWHRIVAVYV